MKILDSQALDNTFLYFFQSIIFIFSSVARFMASLVSFVLFYFSLYFSAKIQLFEVKFRRGYFNMSTIRTCFVCVPQDDMPLTSPKTHIQQN